MSYIHLTIQQRIKIEVLHAEGYSTRQIASRIHVHHATVARELKRVPSDQSYTAQEAQRDYVLKGQRKGRPSKATPQRLQLLQTRLQQTWSPEQIAGRESTLGISYKTIYNWIYQGKIAVFLQVLRRKGASRKPPETRGTFRLGRSIQDRPDAVAARNEFGHWELDTVVSARGKSNHCVATFLERKTRFYVAIPMPNRTSASMWQAIQQLLQALPVGAVRTMTADRGKEFACYTAVEQQGIPFYFADAYAAWQRGSNENSNGLLREFFPKKTDFARVSKEELLHVLLLLNHRPRKCLQFKTPFEALVQELQVSH